MNKIYRTLWNAATQSWVVVSELAKAGGKSASGKSALVNSVSGFSFTLIAASVVLAAGTASAIALGAGAKSNAKAQAVSIGYNSNAKGYQAIAFGSEAKTDETAGSSIAFGTKAYTRSAGSLAFGAEAETGFEGGSATDGAGAVALGWKAKAKAAKTEVVQGENIVVTSAPGANGNTVYTVATAKEVTFDKTTVGSVVTDKNTNDITGLSNKTLGGDTFAKNGRAASEEQLNATQNNLATLLGGNAQNTNGNVTMTDIGGTGKNNINDAIKASRNEVKQGKNMLVTPTVGANGQTIYEVATADKVAFDEVKVGGITMDGTTNKISGIAKGEVSETSTDAVNGSQLHELSKQIMNQSGQGYNILNNRINKVDKDLRAGIAGANAAAGLPQAYIPGKSMVAVAAGTYKGQRTKRNCIGYVPYF